MLICSVLIAEMQYEFEISGSQCVSYLLCYRNIISTSPCELRRVCAGLSWETQQFIGWSDCHVNCRNKEVSTNRLASRQLIDFDFFKIKFCVGQEGEKEGSAGCMQEALNLCSVVSQQSISCQRVSSEKWLLAQ